MTDSKRHRPNHPKPRKKTDWTALKLLTWTHSYFNTHAVESPRTSAELLLSHALGLQRIDLYLQYDRPVNADELNRFKSMIKRRIKKEPVAYILGSKAFWTLDFAVNRDVLIPRPETEHLVEEALDVMKKGVSGAGCEPMRVVDLGTGCGAVILSLAASLPEHLFFATDISARALYLAKKNAVQNRLDPKVSFFSGNWFEPFKQQARFDVIVSNPPYISAGAMENLQPEIRGYEPVGALNGGLDGLEAIRHIICHACCYLKESGSLILEMGHDQEDAIREMVEKSGSYQEVIFKKDYSGNSRVAHLKK